MVVIVIPSTAIMASQTSEKVAEVSADIVVTPAIDQVDEERNETQPRLRSRKETLSAYFTIAAAAFGLIR